jgi:hypothetical protein
LGNGRHVLVNDQIDAVITAGNGNDLIVEGAADASITLGDGNSDVIDMAGAATVVVDNGNEVIALGGTGNHVTVGDTVCGDTGSTMISAGDGDDTVVAGNGSITVAATGADNNVTLGNGHDTIVLGGGMSDGSSTVPVTNDTVNLGTGTSLLFLGGSGNTVTSSGGTDTIRAVVGIDNTFVVSATGGSEKISGFSLTNGDEINLTRALAGVDLAQDLSNLGSYVSVMTKTVGSAVDTILKITGGSATERVTLVNSGTITLSDLTGHNSLILP